MTEERYETPSGAIHYWINQFSPDKQTLVMLPGLMADHRLFEKQVQCFSGECNILVWDAPGHGASRPFRLDFSLMDQAVWLHEILEKEHIRRPVLIGQSMGGYISQCFLQQYPHSVAGFISIDSAPLKRRYVSDVEIFLLKHAETIYRAFPWNTLIKTGVNGCSVTDYGRNLMRVFMECYTKDEYCSLAGHGMTTLATAMENDLPYEIDCPAILLCGKKDYAGSAKSYNRRWSRAESLPIFWIGGAGHNANSDKPEEVNRIIRDFISSL